MKDFFTEGDQLFEQQNLTEAFSAFLKGALNGDTSCMTRVASMYSCGEGVSCDYDEAIKWELKAAELGDLCAMLNLGISYRIKGDILNAKKWFISSFEAGDGSGAIELAKLYLVSDKEKDTVKYYLDQALKSNTLCESEIEEVNQLFGKIIKDGT
ncbi:MAG: sel1 repeat family protein [Gammaproteobacteria bacterium]|nr:MAG: sel1 repeat family protein [Gammaproteobacteria bacterium]